MPSRNTNYARNKGYSNIKRMSSGEPKNYGVKTGTHIDSEKLRREYGKKPFNPPVKKKKE
jgi:hypothetical protein